MANRNDYTVTYDRRYLEWADVILHIFDKDWEDLSDYEARMLLELLYEIYLV